MSIYKIIGRGVVFIGMPLALIAFVSGFKKTKNDNTLHTNAIKWHDKQLLIFLLFLSSFTYSQDTIKVPCFQIVTDTTYQTVTSTSNVTTSITHDSFYRKCNFFGIICNTKKMQTPPHDTTYIVTTTREEMVVTTDTLELYCDSLVSKPQMPTLKNRCSGLSIRNLEWINNITPDWAFVRLIENFIVHVSPEELCPKEGIYNWQPIDYALDFGRRANDNGVDSIFFKLRLSNGIFAPKWAKEKFGKFYIHGSDYDSTGWSQGADSFSVKWWNVEYLNWWALFMDTLAKRYDNNPYIKEIVISGTAPATAEPFNLAIGNSGDGAIRRNNYLDAGCTDELRISALYRSFDAMKAFKRTNISIALNPYEHVLPRVWVDTLMSMQMGEYLAQTFGKQLSLGNNGLRPASVDPKWQPGGNIYQMEKFYQKMRDKYGSGVYNQTASVAQFGGWQNIIPTMDYGAFFRIEFIELPETENKIKANISNADLIKYKNIYKSNQ